MPFPPFAVSALPSSLCWFVQRVGSRAVPFFAISWLLRGSFFWLFRGVSAFPIFSSVVPVSARFSLSPFLVSAYLEFWAVSV